MGKGTIVSEQGEGQYTIAVDYGSARVNARVAIIDAKIAALTDEIADYSAQIVDAKAEHSANLSALNAAIDALSTAIQTGGDVDAATEAVTEATSEATVSGQLVGRLESKRRQLEAEKRSLELAKAALLNLDVEQEFTAWCVNYTTGKAGEVATIEIPGEPDTTLIAAGGKTYVEATDGVVIDRAVLDPNQAYFNAAILPGWQKFQPTYRAGEITAIDFAQDTCSVTLDPAYSSAQGLYIDQESELADVPIDYMSCNATVFEAGDRVVVAFEGQDQESPKVIGFESNPVPCGLLIATGYYEAKTYNGAPNNPYIHIKCTMTDDDVKDAAMANDGVVITINGNAVSDFYDYGGSVTYQGVYGVNDYSQVSFVPEGGDCGAHMVEIVCQDGDSSVNLVLTVGGQTRVSATFTPSSIWPDFFPPDTPTPGMEDDCFYADGPIIAGQAMTVTRGGVNLQEEITWMSYVD